MIHPLSCNCLRCNPVRRASPTALVFDRLCAALVALGVLTACAAELGLFR